MLPSLKRKQQEKHCNTKGGKRTDKNPKGIIKKPKRERDSFEQKAKETLNRDVRATSHRKRERERMRERGRNLETPGPGSGGTSRDFRVARRQLEDEG